MNQNHTPILAHFGTCPFRYSTTLVHTTSVHPISVHDHFCTRRNSRWWMLIFGDCLTGEDTWHVASLASRERFLFSYYVSKVVCVDCVSCVWWRGCNCHWVVRLHGCTVWRRWHLTLSSSFATYNVYRSNILLSLTHIPSRVFLQSLFIMYRSGPKTTEMVHPLVPKLGVHQIRIWPDIQ